MVRYDDRDELRRDQYKDSAKLNTRIDFFTKYGDPNFDWYSWKFEQLDLDEKAIILEVGSGPGDLWVQNLNHCQPGWDVILSDFSHGMVNQARQALSSHSSFQFVCFDIQHIPFPDNMFDRVIADHMLYHVPDRKRAIRELARVLKPGGRLHASTNGENCLKELFLATEQICPALHSDAPAFGGFTLERAGPEFASAFSAVDVKRSPERNTLDLPDAQPAVDFMTSMAVFREALSGKEAALAERIQANIERQGMFHITLSRGLFIASKI